MKMQAYCNNSYFSSNRCKGDRCKYLKMCAKISYFCCSMPAFSLTDIEVYRDYLFKNQEDF